MRKTFFGAVALGVIFITAAISFASAEEQHSMAQAPMDEQKQAGNTAPPPVSGKAVDVGNKICPVTGEKIDEKTKATYAYEGKIYNFCCTACVDEFKKDPQKYIKKIEEERKGYEKNKN